uniref:Uncharacterized protein n=1 Tax=viral metagenome TaxID=1070528 RepID=A0A6M3JGN5_9ZZZZ
MNWILEHYVEVMAILWVLDQIAAATPEDWKIGKFPIGKYDNIVMSFIKSLVKKFIAKQKEDKKGY